MATCEVCGRPEWIGRYDQAPPEQCSAGDAKLPEYEARCYEIGYARERAARETAERERDEAREMLGAQRSLTDDALILVKIAQARAAAAEAALAEARAEVERLRGVKDGAYRERNQVVVALAHLAQRCGWRVGRMLHVGEDWEPDWRTLLFLDLPTGQVTWHFHDSEAASIACFSLVEGVQWDGHDTPEKYRRLAALATPTAEAEKAKL